MVATLFVLLPDEGALAALLASVPSSLQATLARLRRRTYPPAADPRELEYHLLVVRDPAAIVGGGRAMTAMLAGAGLGALASGLCAAFLGSHGGDIEYAVPVGCGMGGVLAASRKDRTRVHPVLSPLLAAVRRGAVLVSWTGRDRNSLEAMRDLCATRNLPAVLRA